MFAPVWQRVVAGTYRQVVADIRDHARYAVIGETYPGLVASVGANVQGVLYFAVASEDVAALDLFEGPDYRRETVVVCLPDGTKVMAETYFYCKKDALSNQFWNPQTFDLQRFINSYCRLK